MCLSAHYKYVHNFSFKGNQPEKKKSYAVIKKKKLSENNPHNNIPAILCSHSRSILSNPISVNSRSYTKAQLISS